jgi:hypothetical protein
MVEYIVLSYSELHLGVSAAGPTCLNRRTGLNCPRHRERPGNIVLVGLDGYS